MAEFDVVVVGGGHNGVTIAAYLAKCGLRVCVCEERSETGGGQENTEPIPGFRIDPHASYLYGYAAPGFEQLNLGDYGFRMVYYRTLMGGLDSKGRAFYGGRYNPDTLKNIERMSKRDAKIWNILETKLAPHMVEFLRTVFWTPPHPPGMEVEPGDLPWSRLMKKHIPELYTDAWNEWTCNEVLDGLFESEMIQAIATVMWYSGAAPNWEGMAIPALAGFQLWYYSSGSPRGGMHTYAHALVRCAIAHGATILSNCPVKEILVKDGRAVGVKLREDAVFPNRVIHADRAVISGVDLRQTFLKLMPDAPIDHGLRQRVKDINLKGGSLWVGSFITKELPRFAGEGAEVLKGPNFPCLSSRFEDRSEYFAQMKDAYSYKKTPDPEHNLSAIINHDAFDPTRCPPGYHVLPPCYMQLVPPEYHVEGPAAINEMKEQVLESQLSHLRTYAPNLTRDKIVRAFINTPYDSEFRNVSLLGGNWYSTRQCRDQWWTTRPLPELARYRTPVKGLYLCNQTSHPGGLCLMAVPYNLMHILIEDGIAKPGEWWYPSPNWVPSPKEDRNGV